MTTNNIDDYLILIDDFHKYIGDILNKGYTNTISTLEKLANDIKKIYLVKKQDNMNTDLHIVKDTNHKCIVFHDTILSDEESEKEDEEDDKDEEDEEDDDDEEDEEEEDEEDDKEEEEDDKPVKFINNTNLAYLTFLNKIDTSSILLYKKHTSIKNRLSNYIDYLSIY